MKTLRNILIPFAAICFMLMAACERRPLEDPENFANIRIAIQTNTILNINKHIYNEKIAVPDITPEVMHVLFFEEHGDELVTEAYISNRSTDENNNTVISGDIQIYPGNYKLMVYNFGTESSIIRDYNHWSNAYAYTNTVSDKIVSAYKSKLPEEEHIVYEPDHLLLHTNDDLFIPYHSGIHTINATAETIVDTYYLQIKVEGLEYVSSAQAFLTGMAGGNTLAENKRNMDEPHTIYFSLQKSDDKGVPVICNIFNTFGHIPDSGNKLEVTFDLRTLDGKTVQHTFDITDVFKTPEAIEKHWLLINKTIKIDPPEKPSTGNGGGMDPSVSEWEDENHDIIL